MSQSNDSLPISNPTLIEGIIQRELTILSFLYDSYGPLLYGSILRVIKNPVRATQILKETFLYSIRHINMHNPQLRLYTWFQRIAWYKTLEEAAVTVTRKPLPDGLEMDNYTVSFSQLNKFEQRIIDLLIFKGLSHEEMCSRMELVPYDLQQQIIATLTHFHSLLS